MVANRRATTLEALKSKIQSLKREFYELSHFFLKWRMDPTVLLSTGGISFPKAAQQVIFNITILSKSSFGIFKEYLFDILQMCHLSSIWH